MYNLFIDTDPIANQLLISRSSYEFTFIYLCFWNNFYFRITVGSSWNVLSSCWTNSDS